MSTRRDIDRSIAAWLEVEASDGASKRLLEASRDRVRTTRQRRALGPTWRIPVMHNYAKVAIGVAAVAVLAVVGINLLTVNPGLVAGPTASPAASAAAAPLPSPSNSPAAEVDASAPANSIEAPPSSGDPAPSASAVPQPTPTPDPEAVRTAAAAQYLTAAQATTQAFEALQATDKAYYRGAAEIWGQFAADLEKLQVPADTAADQRDLIRKVKKVQVLFVEASGHFARMDDFYIVARHLRNARSRASAAVDRVRSDLDLPALCRAGCPEPPPIG
jgi:hypothetical protein